MVNFGSTWQPVFPVVRIPAASRNSSTLSSAAFVQDEQKRDAIYVAAFPLRAPGPAQMLVSACYSLPLWEPQHFIVIIGQHVRSSPEIKVPNLRPSRASCKGLIFDLLIFNFPACIYLGRGAKNQIRHKLATSVIYDGFASAVS